MQIASKQNEKKNNQTKKIDAPQKQKLYTFFWKMKTGWCDVFANAMSEKAFILFQFSQMMWKAVGHHQPTTKEKTLINCEKCVRFTRPTNEILISSNKYKCQKKTPLLNQYMGKKYGERCKYNSQSHFSICVVYHLLGLYTVRTSTNVNFNSPPAGPSASHSTLHLQQIIILCTFPIQ